MQVVKYSNKKLKDFKQSILKEPLILNWFKCLNRNTKNEHGFSDHQQACYLSGFRTFLNFLNKGPDKFSKLTLEELVELGNQGSNGEQIIDLLNAFFDWMQGITVKGYTPRTKQISYNSAVTLSYAYVRGFFTYNGVNFGKWTPKKHRESKIKTTDILDENALINDGVLDRAKLQSFMHQLSFRDQVILACLLSGGGNDIGDLLRLKMSNLKRRMESRIFWTGRRAKTDKKFQVFFSLEATRLLDEYVKQERKNATSEDFVFVPNSQGSVKSHKRKRRFNYDNDDPETEQIKIKGILTSEAVSQAFRTAAQNVGALVEGGQHPFRPKRFRHIFNTLCVQAEVRKQALKIFQGHAEDVSEGYSDWDIKALLKEYLKVEPLLEIYSSPTKISQDEEIITLKKQLNSLQNRFDELIELIIYGGGGEITYKGQKREIHLPINGQY